MDDARSAEFEEHRGLLFAVAYRMLGTATDAEDVVQEAFLRYRKVEDVRTPKQFLVKTVTRLCLDQLKSAREQREHYVGPWLPEPIETSVSPQEQIVMSESISMAFLVLLESLSPLERAVYLLREVFSYEYGEIATITGRSETAVRQVFHRAQTHIVERRPRFTVAPEQHRQVVERFMMAIGMGDLDSLQDLLTEDVALWSDGGGKRAAATRPLYGREAVIRFLMGLRRGYVPERMGVDIRQVNGREAFVLIEDGKITSVFNFEIENDRVRVLHIIRNPDKLNHV